jgi:hypothetical protein
MEDPVTTELLLDRLLELHAPTLYLPQPYQYTGCRVCRATNDFGPPMPIPWPCPTVEAIEEYRDGQPR